ncbi:LOW QUALITY PROTEIN: hypothetical protein RJ641_009916, partial [Dillenia turbinata]
MNVPYGMSMKDSLAAVRNATQAAAYIYQVFRVQSFQKKQLEEYGNEKLGLSDDHISQEYMMNLCRQLQSIYRINFGSWKCRKDYLTIQKRIIKIQREERLQKALAMVKPMYPEARDQYGMSLNAVVETQKTK